MEVNIVLYNSANLIKNILKSIFSYHFTYMLLQRKSGVNTYQIFAVNYKKGVTLGNNKLDLWPVNLNTYQRIKSTLK